MDELSSPKHTYWIIRRLDFRSLFPDHAVTLLMRRKLKSGKKMGEIHWRNLPVTCGLEDEATCEPGDQAQREFLLPGEPP
ncbi:MAG: hypothetical protein QXV37_01195 [Candidatus Jordarchaeaceae archaeon]